MKILTLKLFQTCVNFFLLLNTKDDILKNVSNQTVDGPSMVFLFFFFRPWKSSGPIDCLVTHILQNIIFYVRQMKDTLEQLEDELMTEM